MRSLRNRIAALLILAILSVVAVATFVASRAMERPVPEAAITPIARQLLAYARLVEQEPDSATKLGLALHPEPAPGPPDLRETEIWSRALQMVGSDHGILVTGLPGGQDGRGLVGSMDLRPAGWLIVELPDMRPPPGGREVLIGWMGLILIGATGVSLIAASRITAPLRVLQMAAGRITADGTLAPIPETGLPETRATARALNLLSARLRGAMESRMRLVAAAGHDLRTPMTRMRLRAEFIEDEEERAKWLADLEELDAIADSAIRLVREEVSKDASEPVRMDLLLAEITTELAGQGYPVGTGDLAAITVSAGPLALKRAMRNLVINAATHGGGAQVTLVRRGARAVVTILDDGPGIPEALLAQVFEPFFRPDISRRKSLPGAGLGLAIAREIIARFDGTVHIENRETGGLHQTVTLPAA